MVDSLVLTEKRFFSFRVNTIMQSYLYQIFVYFFISLFNLILDKTRVTYNKLPTCSISITNPMTSQYSIHAHLHSQRVVSQKMSRSPARSDHPTWPTVSFVTLNPLLLYNHPYSEPHKNYRGMGCREKRINHFRTSVLRENVAVPHLPSTSKC